MTQLSAMFSGAYRALDWRPIPDLDRYEVSSEGHIRLVGSDHIRSPYQDGDGYLRVCVGTDKGPRSISIHRAVALAFHGDKRNALHREVAHLDGNRANPRADNLKWVSKVENMSHKLRHGTRQAGERHPRAKLSAAQALSIRNRSRAGEACSSLGREFGISEATARDIRSGRLWKCLQADHG
jgi:hypothetical protein